MTLDQAIAFAIVAGLMALFVWGRIRYDVAAMLGLALAILTGIVPVEKAFTGFSDQVVIIVASALVISAGVAKSGVIGRLIRLAAPSVGTPGAQVLALSSGVGILSSFVKNIGALAIFMPVATQMARRSGTSVSILLMPMAFGSLIGGITTLVGTSPNILVSRVREDILGEPFGMFDFTPVGLGILVAGLAFLSVGWRLIPKDRAGRTPSGEAFRIEDYVVEATVPESSPFAGKTVADLEAISEGEVAVVAIIRGQGRRYVPKGHWHVAAADILVLQGDAPGLREFVEEAKLELVGSEGPGEADPPAELSVVEAVVVAGSPLVGRTPSELRLRDRFGVHLVAISRPGEAGRTRIRRTRFRVGDVLILQGSTEGTFDTLRDIGCLPLIDRATGIGSRRKDYLPLVILGVAVALVATNILPVVTAFFGAAVLLVLTRVLTIAEAYDSIDLSILVLIACLIPVSDAITSTGAAQFVANGLAYIAGSVPPTGAVAVVMVAAMAVTPFLNNAATVLIMAPIAASVAKDLGLNPDPFLMAVAIGAACDFLTPVGHQCNTLVMGPGGYRFGDYWRLGLPLSAIVVVVGTALIPVFWSFG